MNVLLTHTYLTPRHQCISTLPFFRPFHSQVRQLSLYRQHSRHRYFVDSGLSSTRPPLVRISSPLRVRVALSRLHRAYNPSYVQQEALFGVLRRRFKALPCHSTSRKISCCYNYINSRNLRPLFIYAAKRVAPS